jgi:glycosyltransferase involved in cell wall biosynthesis
MSAAPTFVASPRSANMSARTREPMTGAITILQVITRLNVGGTAQHVITLASQLNGGAFQSLLITGQPESSEGDLSGLLTGTRVRHVRLTSLRRPIRPWRDLHAWWQLFRIIRRERPAVVHTHTAKAGTLGRAATLLSNQLVRLERAVTGRQIHECRLVHTFHGHVLERYFGRVRSTVFLWIERMLGWQTNRIIAVSPAVRADLIRLKIGREGRLRVVRLGLPLNELLALPLPREDVAPITVGFVGRLVPIKRPGLFLELAARAKDEPQLCCLRFILVGDGELRQELELQVKARGLTESVTFTGWQTAMASVYQNLDIVCLTSLNEGTPVSLIESLAAGRAVLATDVGGVRDLLGDIQHGPGRFRLTQHGVLADAEALYEGLRYLVTYVQKRLAMGRAGRAFVREHYSTRRLIEEMEVLYQEVVA